MIIRLQHMMLLIMQVVQVAQVVLLTPQQGLQVVLMNLVIIILRLVLDLDLLNFKLPYQTQ